MSETEDICQMCRKEKFKYKCPKCDMLYCTVNCYRSPEHLKCSEEFYKSCIQEELTTSAPSSSKDMQKIFDILKRIHATDAGADAGSFEDALDSDDEPCGEGEEEPQDGNESDEEDIAIRLQGVDINDADEVWQRLTEEEQADFQKMIECGDIMKLLPSYTPWWVKAKKSKIVEITPTTKEENEDIVMPKIKENIPALLALCKKAPSPCLHYNIWNILAAYGCTARFFSGELHTNASEVTAHLVNLSATLKYGTNFEDAEEAVLSVEMEALTTGNGAASSVGGVKNLLLESREQLQYDARQLMSTRENKLAALSDILQLLQMTKQQLKSGKSKEAEFQKLFALCSGSVELNRTKLQQLAKKMEFLLSYANRDYENE